MEQTQLDWAREILRISRTITPHEWIARWMTAIACHESAWGRSMPKDGSGPTYNCIGYMWSPGFGWKYAKSREAGTGEQKLFRKFRDYEECMNALHYLIARSKLPTYAAARTAYYADNTPDAEAQERWMRGFSEGYCPVDPRHGEKVLSIYKRLEEIA